MKTGLIIFLSTLVLIILFVPGQIWSMELLTDQQLDAVTAGSKDSASHSDEALTRIPFHYSSGKGHVVDGEVIVVPMSSYYQTATLQLMDNAQSNLRSLININAVNSPVQILLNLNINVNSTIANLNQWNQLLSETRTWR